jgi:hypothetical protein
MKYLILILFFILFSCGTRKVENTKKDSISINNTYSNGSKIVLSNDITFEPIDALKPFKIEGKEYLNVKVTNSKKEIVEKWRYKNITKTITIEKTKVSEKKDNANLWIGLFVALVLGIIIYIKLK